MIDGNGILVFMLKSTYFSIVIVFESDLDCHLVVM